MTISRSLALAVLATSAAAAPAAATGQGVSYDVYAYAGSLADCQLAGSVALSNAGFKHVSTVKSKGGASGAVFADIGTYQAIVICDRGHKSATITVVGTVQAKTHDYVVAISSAFR